MPRREGGRPKEGERKSVRREERRERQKNQQRKGDVKCFLSGLLEERAKMS